MKRSRRLTSLVVGLLVAGFLWYFLLRLVGIEAILAALRAADRRWVLVVLLLALGWMAAWSGTLAHVLAGLGRPVPRWRAALVYLVVLLSNDVAPFSFGGGEPLAAYLVSRTTRTRYETALLLVASSDVLNYLPSPVLAVLALAVVASRAALGRGLETVLALLLAVSVLLVVGGFLAWRGRRRLAALAVDGLVAGEAVVARVLPDLPRPRPSTIRDRVGGFVEGLERIAEDRRRLARGLGTATVGWALQAEVLWASLQAIGVSTSAAVTVAAVTLVTVTDLVPLPGGIGSVDAALVLLLVALTPATAPEAAAAALVFRAATLVLPVLLGAASLLVLRATRSAVG